MNYIEIMKPLVSLPNYGRLRLGQTVHLKRPRCGCVKGVDTGGDTGYLVGIFDLGDFISLDIVTPEAPEGGWMGCLNCIEEKP